jgi:hypothetical protein
VGNSSVKLQSILDSISGMGVPVPTTGAGGYAMQLVLDNANDVAADLITDRFNWKFNSANAPAFYTNSFQQDYPQPGNTTISWLESADRVDINNTSLPKPVAQLTVRRQLSRTSYGTGPIKELCWMYNGDMTFGTWPGAGVTYTPLVGNVIVQNPIMNFVDKNGNILIVTGFGTTGTTAPFLPASSGEGLTVVDGTVTWTCVSANSKGFRVFSLPGGSGPVWMITPIYQKTPPRFTALSQTLDPFPDDYERYFRELYRIYCLKTSPNPSDRQQFAQERIDYMKALVNICKQGDKEQNAYGMLPASSVVESVFPNLRNPRDPSQPY